MNFDEITEGKLWAVRYDGNEDNELQILFDKWTDPSYLFEFFKEHINDLAYFKVTSIEEAVNDTMDDSDEMERVIFESTTNLEEIFRPLDNRVGVPKEIEKMKSKGKTDRHPSWLRIYAIRLTDGKYIITGGAIKLTKEMKDREHTRKELMKIDRVRHFLIDEGIVDDEGFIDYLAEL